jgi:hypothetical protein
MSNSLNSILYDIEKVFIRFVAAFLLQGEQVDLYSNGVFDCELELLPWGWLAVYSSF